MLTQTGGTLGQPIDLGNYTDPKHYKLLEPEGARAIYGLITLPRRGRAFTSCRRFSGKFYVQPNGSKSSSMPKGWRSAPKSNGRSRSSFAAWGRIAMRCSQPSPAG